MSESGRPTLYKERYCKDIIDYFSVKPYEKVGDDYCAADFPSFAGFASKIGVHRETLLNWCEEYQEFFDAYKRAKELQENFLIVNGNRGLINTAFGIFTAKNVLKWSDKPAEETKDDSASEIKLKYALPEKK